MQQQGHLCLSFYSLETSFKCPSVHEPSLNLSLGEKGEKKIPNAVLFQLVGLIVDASSNNNINYTIGKKKRTINLAYLN